MRCILGVLVLTAFGVPSAVMAEDARVPDPKASLARRLRVLRVRAGEAAPSETAKQSLAPRLAAKAPIGTYEYEPIAIEPSSGRTRSRAHGLNDLGQVVGRSESFDDVSQSVVDRAAFVWDPLFGTRALPALGGESSAWGLSNGGKASGWADTAEMLSHAVRWDTTSMTVLDLGTLVNPTSGQAGTISYGYEVGDQGVVAGESEIPNDDGTFMASHGFRYSEAGGLQDLGTFDTSYPEYQYGYSIAYGVNGAGEIVGTAAYTGSGAWLFRPFIHDAAGGLRQLPIDAAHETGEWYGVAINDSGMIGGLVIADADQSLPYYWTSETASPIAVTMPTAYPYGEIYGINAQGVMVGIMWNAAQEERAFVFDAVNGVRDLNALVDPTLGCLLSYARDINDSGQIAAGGLLNGEERGFMLSPWALAGRIEGSVRHSSTAEPLAGVSVDIYAAAGARVAQSVTDAVGHYAVALAPGTYYGVARNTLGGADQLYAGHPCSGCDPTTGDPLNVTAGTTVADVDFFLGSPSVSIGDVTVIEGSSGASTRSSVTPAE
jgi:uncharacterized membrane protein